MLALVGCSDNLTLPPERQPFQAAEPAPLECVPNLDQQITSDELLVGFDVPVAYRINPQDEPRPVDLVGLVDQDGVQVWDFSSDDASDEELRIAAENPVSKWYAASFPDADFVAALDASARIDGVYRRTDSGVFLLGYASTEEAPPEGKTLVVYDSPVALYQLPLTDGSEWVSVGEIRNATVRDLPYAGRDVYTVRVDGLGELWLPELQFDEVLRIRTDLAIEPSIGEGLTRKQVSYVFECFGEVARVVSADDESEEDFDRAVELRRLGI